MSTTVIGDFAEAQGMVSSLNELLMSYERLFTHLTTSGVNLSNVLNFAGRQFPRL